MTRASKQSWGSVAVASSGSIDIEIDATTSGPEWIQLNISTPGFQFRFDIVLDTVRTWLAFLQHHLGRTGVAELGIGTFLGRRVWIIKDDEHPDRFFLTVRGAQSVCFTIVDPVASQLIEALGQIATELS